VLAATPSAPTCSPRWTRRSSPLRCDYGRQTLSASLDLALLPAPVLDVFARFRTCEFSTIAADGAPITWPVAPILWPERGLFVVLTSIGLPQKAVNVRRTPRVSLLFSDPTGSGLADPPAVLVQGDASAPETVSAGMAGLEPSLRAALVAQARRTLSDQPEMAAYLRNPLAHALMDWYFIRIGIFIAPRRIRWWECGDMTGRPQELEVNHVA
jgi:hypothetical protein